MNDILSSYKIVLANLRNILQQDIAIGLTNTNEFIEYYKADKFDLNAEPGQRIREGEPLWHTIKENKLLVCEVPKELYGTPIKAITSPIRDDNGQVIGAVAIGMNLKEKFEVEESIDNIFSSLEETNASLQGVSEDTQNLFSIINNVIKYAKDAGDRIKASTEIIGSIQNIASQSNLLGLNAAIEASRAGEHGRGFSVVASEMRKLAQISKESSQRVSNDLSELNKSVELMIKAVNAAGTVSENQTSAIQQITAAVEEITSNYQLLVKFVDDKM